jgi:hypothetical protein
MKTKFHFTLLTILMLLCFSIMVLSCTPPVEEKCPPPDASKITVSRGTIATGGMVISGGAGAVQPGATVTITDSQGHTVTTTADPNGGFTLVEADLPEDFDHTLGNELSITQKSEGCTESDAVEVAIGA